MEPIELFTVDDHPVVRAGLRSLLATYPDFRVCGEASNATDAFAKITEERPDVALIDFDLGGESGLDLAARLRRTGVAIKIVMLTAYDDPETFRVAAQAGVDGFLPKATPPDQIAAAIRTVHAGGRALAPSMADIAFDLVVRQEEEHAVDILPESEHLVLARLADGQSIHAIANELYLSERTVKRRISSACDRLGVQNRSQAIARAFELGLL